MLMYFGTICIFRSIINSQIKFYRTLSNQSKIIKIVEVAPRDGLQNEKKILSSADKIKFIDKLSDTGLKYIEATSFVSAEWIPQLADGFEVMRGINRHEGIIYSALVPNMTGFKKALDCQVDEIAVFGAVSETFCKKNINCSIEDSFKRFTPVIEAAKKANLRVRGYVSCIIGCPYEGPIHPRKSASIISRMLTMGCYEVSLGDTIGSGSPDSWRTLINMCYQEFGIPLSKMAVHCHDISGGAAAIDNIEAALEMGITTIDSSTGGIGGCPYADGIARGNVPTEDVIHKLNQLHLNTGVDVDKVLDAGNFICKILNIQNISRYASLKH